MKHLEVNGKLTEKKNTMSVNVFALQDKKDQVHAQFDVDAAARTLDMKAYYDPGMTHYQLQTQTYIQKIAKDDKYNLIYLTCRQTW